jgi:hypothetical protein
MRFTIGCALTAALALGAAACGADDTNETSTTEEKPAGAPLPASVVTSKEPGGARNVGDVKATAKEGDEVVVRGLVGGAKAPVVPGRAVFTIADLTTLHACTEMAAGSCTTPWDYCCETPEHRAENTLTVQVLGADGKPLAVDVGESGVVPLAKVTVKGKVGPRPDAKVLVVDATEVYVAK